MYHINIKFVKKGQWFWWGFVFFGILMSGILLMEIFSVNEKTKYMDSKILSNKVEVKEKKMFLEEFHIIHYIIMK